MRRIVYRNYIFEALDSDMIPETLYHGSNQRFTRFELGHSNLGQNLYTMGEIEHDNFLKYREYVISKLASFVTWC